MRRPITPADVPPWGAAEAMAVIGSLLSGQINRGRGPGRLEHVIGRQIGAGYVRAVNSCRTAIELALRGLEVGPGAEVVLPSYLCHSALDPVLQVGATPIFADCGLDLQLSVVGAEQAISSRTRVILAPHLYGNAIEIEQLEDLVEGTPISLVDDAAQSFGAIRSGRYLGTFGSCGVVSCAPSKALSGSGGGLLISNDSEVAESWDLAGLGEEPSLHAVRRVLRLWVWLRYARLTAPLKRAGREDQMSRGGTSSHRATGRRMAHLDAVLALQQLDPLGDGPRRRRAWSTVAEALRGQIDGELIEVAPHAVPRNVVVILDASSAKRGDVLERFRQAGVEARPGYAPLHLSRGSGDSELPVTEQLWRRVVVVPIGDSDRTAGALERA